MNNYLNLIFSGSKVNYGFNFCKDTTLILQKNALFHLTVQFFKSQNSILIHIIVIVRKFRTLKLIYGFRAIKKGVTFLNIVDNMFL